MLTQVSKTKLNHNISTTYRRICFYGIPCVYKKSDKREKVLFIDKKYLKYLKSDPEINVLKKLVIEWIDKNTEDDDLYWAFMDTFEKMDKYELVRFCIKKKLY